MYQELVVFYFYHVKKQSLKKNVNDVANLPLFTSIWSWPSGINSLLTWIVLRVKAFGPRNSIHRWMHSSWRIISKRVCKAATLVHPLIMWTLKGGIVLRASSPPKQSRGRSLSLKRRWSGLQTNSISTPGRNGSVMNPRHIIKHTKFLKLSRNTWPLFPASGK